MKEKIFKFLLNKKGSVTIEFVLLLIVLVIMFTFMFDLVLMRSTIGKLERTSYSLLNIVKEKSEFHSNRNTLLFSDVQQMQELATSLMYGENGKNKKQVDVYLEYLELENPKDRNDRTRAVINQEGIGSSPTSCKPFKQIVDLKDSSPISEGQGAASNPVPRSVPIYQVTVCTEVDSLFKSILVSKQGQSLGLLRASSLGPER